MLTKTLFMVQFREIEKSSLIAQDVAAGNMEEAISMIREAYHYPRIYLLQDKNISVLVRS